MYPVAEAPSVIPKMGYIRMVCIKLDKTFQQGSTK